MGTAMKKENRNNRPRDRNIPFLCTDNPIWRWMALAALSLACPFLSVGGTVRASGVEMTVMMDMEIPLSFDAGKNAFVGEQPVSETCHDEHAHRMIDVSLPEGFRMETPAGSVDAPDGTAVSFDGTMTARRGYHNLNSDDPFHSVISVQVPFTEDFLEYGAGGYSLSIPVNMTMEEAYGSYSTDYSFTPWDRLLESGRAETDGADVLEKVAMAGDALDIPPVYSGLGKRFLSLASYRSVDVPYSVTSADSAFTESGVREICFWGENAAVPRAVCKDAKALEKAVLADGVTGFGDWAFKGCTALKDFTFPPSMQHLGSFSFQDCISLKTLTIQGNLATDALSSASSPLNGTGIETVAVDEGVTEIPSYLYTGAASLKRLVLPSSLQAIGSYAFSGCTSLEELTIRSDFSISKFRPPFDGGGIRTVAFEEGVTAITSRLFDGSCGSMTDVYIPVSVKTVGSYAFRGGSGITVHYAGTEAQWETVERNGWTPEAVIFGDSGQMPAASALSMGMEENAGLSDALMVDPDASLASDMEETGKDIPDPEQAEETGFPDDGIHLDEDADGRASDSGCPEEAEDGPEEVMEPQSEEEPADDGLASVSPVSVPSESGGSPCPDAPGEEAGLDDAGLPPKDPEDEPDATESAAG